MAKLYGAILDQHKKAKRRIFQSMKIRSYLELIETPNEIPNLGLMEDNINNHFRN